MISQAYIFAKEKKNFYTHLVLTTSKKECFSDRNIFPMGAKKDGEKNRKQND